MSRPQIWKLWVPTCPGALVCTRESPFDLLGGPWLTLIDCSRFAAADWLCAGLQKSRHSRSDLYS